MCIRDSGRWAKKNGKKRVAGHEAGAKAVNKVVDAVDTEVLF